MPGQTPYTHISEQLRTPQKWTGLLPPVALRLNPILHQIGLRPRQRKRIGRITFLAKLCMLPA
jgi:hypothetical protein